MLTGYAHVDLVCADLERSLAFYRAVLAPVQLEDTAVFEGERGEPIHYLRFPETGSLGLRQGSGPEAAQRFALYAPGLHHFALAVDGRRHVERVHAAAVAAGAEVLHPPTAFPAYHPHYYATFFLDPDGVRVEVRTKRAPGVRPDGPVTLREVTQATVRIVCDLELMRGQEQYVAPAATTLAEAQFEPTAWVRAIHAGERVVGLVACADDAGEHWLWRLLVAAPQQGTGIGRDAMQLVIERARGLPGVRRMLTSYVPGPDPPRDFYLRLGFEDTGRDHEGERVLALEL